MIPYFPAHPLVFPLTTGIVSTFVWITALIIANGRYKRRRNYRGFIILASFILAFFLASPYGVYKVGGPKYFMHVGDIMFGLPAILQFLIISFDSIFLIRDNFIMRREKIILDAPLLISIEYLCIGGLAFVLGLLRLVRYFYGGQI